MSKVKMGKKNATNAPAAWLHGDATRTMKGEVERALAAYMIDEGIVPCKGHRTLIKFQDLLPYTKLFHQRWKDLSPDTLNTVRQKCMKQLCQHMHNIKADYEYCADAVEEVRLT